MTPEFSMKMRGYDKQEVDEYLNRLRGEYAQACVHLQNRIRELEAAQKSQDDIANAMIFAQSLAKETQEKAQDDADKVLNKAQSEADQTVRFAQSEAEKVLNNAQARSSQLIEQANQRYQDVYEKMKRVQQISSECIREMEAGKLNKETAGL